MSPMMQTFKLAHWNKKKPIANLLFRHSEFRLSRDFVFAKTARESNSLHWECLHMHYVTTYFSIYDHLNGDMGHMALKRGIDLHTS